MRGEKQYKQLHALHNALTNRINVPVTLSNLVSWLRHAPFRVCNPMDTTDVTETQSWKTMSKVSLGMHL